MRVQAVLFMVMPGIQVLGRPLPNRNNLRLVYNCNGVSSFALTNAIAFTLHYTGVFPMHKIIENLGALIVVGMIVGELGAPSGWGWGWGGGGVCYTRALCCSCADLTALSFGVHRL